MYITLLKRPFKCINTGTCMKMLSHNLHVSVLSYDNCIHFDTKIDTGIVYVHLTILKKFFI